MYNSFPETLPMISERNLISLHNRIVKLEDSVTDSLPLSFCVIKARTTEELSELINNFLRVHNITNNTLHCIEEKIIHHHFSIEYMTTFWYNETPDLLPPFQRGFQNEKDSGKEGA
jgi:hypothetical protein